MQSLERRIAALESQNPRDGEPLTVRLVTVEAGETKEQAIRRAGYSPDADRTMFVCLVGMEARSPAA